ncbi:MAG: N-acetyltransferase [Pseudomonadota bacterium]
MTGHPNSIEVTAVSDKAGLKEFLSLPFRLYADDPHWVPPLYLERQDHLSAKNNPYYQHAEVQLFTAWRAGRCVGRISAQVCQLHLKHHQDHAGQFGFIEAEDDAEVFSALLGAAENWLRERGLRCSRGPFSHSINEEVGLLVEGFDTPPQFLMGHARPYYDALIAQAGYAKAKDLLAYRYDPQHEIPRAMATMVKKVSRSGDMEVRRLSKKNLARDLDVIISIFNDAWSDNWNFVPMTQAEINHLGQNLKLLVPEEFISIAYYQNQPAAMAVSLPNINEAIADLNGKILPFGWAKLLWRSQRAKFCRSDRQWLR